jgi:hypothetical protein
VDEEPPKPQAPKEKEKETGRGVLGGGFRKLLTAATKARFGKAARAASVKAVPAWLRDFLQAAGDAPAYQMHHDPRYCDRTAHHAAPSHEFKIKAPSLSL